MRSIQNGKGENLSAQNQVNKVGAEGLTNPTPVLCIFKLTECGRALSASSITSRNLASFFLDCVCKMSRFLAINVSSDGYTMEKQFVASTPSLFHQIHNIIFCGSKQVFYRELLFCLGSTIPFFFYLC